MRIINHLLFKSTFGLDCAFRSYVLLNRRLSAKINIKLAKISEAYFDITQSKYRKKNKDINDLKMHNNMAIPFFT